MRKILTSLVLLAPLVALAQYPVGHRTVTYTDAARNNRQIACEVYYPATAAGNDQPMAAGQFPVVAFGHGFVMTVSAYQSWWEHVVPRGYIMILPSTEGGVPPNHLNFGLDLRFVADQMVADGQVAGTWSGHVTDRIGIMGHSMGGGSTILEADGNPIVDCIVAMAAAETDPSAMAAAANVTAPALLLYGTSDNVAPEANHGLGIYNALGSSCKNYVRITNGSHCFFADFSFTCSLGETVPGSLTRADQLAKSFALVDPWLDYFLKDLCPAWQTLQTGLSGGVSGITVTNECPNTAPIIVDQAGNLESTGAPTYQWFVDGNAIPNATQQTYAYTTSGTYYVETTNVGNCPVQSNSVVIDITGIDANFKAGVRYSAGLLQLPNDHGFRQLAIMDMQGRTISQSTITTNSVQLNLPAQGVYVVRLMGLKGVVTVKVVEY